MATGRSTQLTRQVGEHLVAAELGRMGIIATPFAGNVPAFDLLAANEHGKAIPIQVKAISGPSWQFNARSFLRINIKDGFQRVQGLRSDVDPSLVCVLVRLVAPGADEFYTLTFGELQRIFKGKYKSRARPKNPESTHCALWPEEAAPYLGWSAVEAALGDGTDA